MSRIGADSYVVRREVVAKVLSGGLRGRRLLSCLREVLGGRGFAVLCAMGPGPKLGI